MVDPMDPGTYIWSVLTSDTDQPVNSISEIDFNPYVLTKYEVGAMYYGASLLQKLDTLTLTSMAYLETVVSKVLILYGFDKIW